MDIDQTKEEGEEQLQDKGNFINKKGIKTKDVIEPSIDLLHKIIEEATISANEEQTNYMNTPHPKRLDKRENEGV
jgi:hypothetical protein